MWQNSAVGGDAGIAVLTRGERALPGCSLLYLAHAELAERKGEVEAAKEVGMSHTEGGGGRACQVGALLLP